jgi:transcription-repair coupling factor (superfamily II helicase)
LSTLSDLFAHLLAHPDAARIVDGLAPGRTVTVGGLTPMASLFVAGGLPVDGWLLVAPNAETARRWQSDLAAFGVDAVTFLPVEVPPYQGVSPEEELLHARQRTLAALAAGEATRVITTPKAIAMRLPTPDAWRDAALTLKVGDALAPAELTQALVKLGYRPAAAVADKTEFSRRGGILDVYPPQSDRPARLEFFGDEIDSIRGFDPATQRSDEPLSELRLWPTRELILPTEGWDAAAGRIKAAAREKINMLNGGGRREEAAKLQRLVDADLEKLGSFQYFEGCELYAPFFGRLGTLLDYVPPTHPVIWADRQALSSEYDAWVKLLMDAYSRRLNANDMPKLPQLLHLTWEELQAGLSPFSQLDLTANAGAIALETHAPVSFGNQFDRLADSVKAAAKAGETLVIASVQPQRVFAILDERGAHATYGGRLPEPGAPYGGTWIVRESLSSGFSWPDLGFTLITDHELFGWQKRPGRREKRPAHAGAQIATIGELVVGDHVVHSKHGIGQYQGMRRLEVNGLAREYLLIAYRGDDKLYVPVDQIGLLHRYRGGAEGAPRINKMGGADWANVKSRVKKAVQELAFDLLKLYAQRAAQPGYAHPADTVWQAEMEEGFPYDETPDQLRAISEVKRDMEAPRPMDRLICGDVGFGKTEVALRGVFKAVMSGKQVAVLAPTTLLAHQHYQVLRERFAPYPVKLGLMSRFRTAKEQKETLRALGTGGVDIVVGTHRLLQKDVAFKDLGLVVIDEEHRFGVAHKERMKQLKTSIDVLTMSATPIPRTLYLALSGARDMSLITTPPRDRQPVKTTVSPYDPEIMRTAILHELERGGQVFVLHNRIDSIHRVAAEIQELVPQAKVVVGHGQMNENELEDVMLSFLDREYDVLVATTIIESGLDIPNANTIVVDDADRLGLAQLYQIRGRVGRSDVKAYCHCFYRAGKELTDEARDRLQALQQFTALGSGYQIALRDMEIRGVGNILGPEQSGNMLAVGYETFMQLLEEAVQEAQGTEVVAEREEALVDLNVAAYLPDDWFEAPAAKMEEYKRLAVVSSLTELELLGADWRDRFGPPPPAVKNLLKVVALKLKATEVGASTVRSDAKHIRVALVLPRSRWADLSLKTPGLSRWSWSEGELTLGRDGQDMLAAVDKLLDALGARALAAAG